MLIGDLRAVLKLYEQLVQADTDDAADPGDSIDSPTGALEEDGTKFRLHKRIERNPKIVKEVKAKKGYSCEVCTLSFADLYGEIGKEFIEAHHLKPLASLKGQKASLDPVKDFAVLCSNCHRMVHRSGLIADIAEFKRLHFNGC